MAGKTTAKAPSGTAADKPQTRAKPGPKPGAAKAATKPAAAKPADPKPEAPTSPEQLAMKVDHTKENSDTFMTIVEVGTAKKVFLENMAHALIFDIFQMHQVLHALRSITDVEASYFLDFYASRLRPLLVEDILNGDIGGLLDLGVWYALDGQEEILTEGLITRLGDDIQATPEQTRKLAIEAVYGDNRNETPSRGERWMPALHRNSSREDLERVAPGHGGRSASDARESTYTSRRNR